MTAAELNAKHSLQRAQNTMLMSTFAAFCKLPIIKFSYIDPYMDTSIFQVLGTLSSAVLAVKLLTSKIPVDFGLEAQKFVKQHSGFSIEARRTKDFHDRFIILD